MSDIERTQLQMRQPKSATPLLLCGMQVLRHALKQSHQLMLAIEERATAEERKLDWAFGSLAGHLGLSFSQVRPLSDCLDPDRYPDPHSNANPGHDVPQ